MLALRALLSSTVCLVALAMPQWSVAAPGDPDPSFGSGGIVTTNLGAVEQAKAIALQPDGKLIAAGSKLVGDPEEGPPNSDIAVARYNPDGSLDPTFGTGGIVITVAGPDTYEDAQAVLVQPDGKIVVGGSHLIVRYEPAGTLDATFGSGGMVADSATSLVLQPDGKIVAASVGQDDLFDFRLTRYNADGSLDASFGTGGVVTTPIGAGTYDVPNALVLQPDGKLVAAGYTQAPDSDFALVRYASDGSLDATFGTGGIIVWPQIPGHDVAYALALALQADGKLVAAGRLEGDLALVRFDTDGSIDPLFGSGGAVTTSISSSLDLAQGLVAQPDGTLVAAGFAGSPGHIALVAYQSDGSLDTGFGAGGIVTTAVGVGSGARALVRQPDAKLVIAGVTAPTATYNSDVALVRYAGTSSIAALCGTVPATGCRAPTQPAKSQLSIKDKAPDSKDLFQWAWTAGAATSLLDFGTPATTTDYAVCVYDESGGTPSLAMIAAIPAAGLCGSKPCWKATTHSFKFADKDGSPDGVVSLTLQAGADGKAKIKLKARGVKLPTPALPFSQDSTVTVQLVNEIGTCWDTDFAAPAIMNTPTDFHDKGQ